LPSSRRNPGTRKRKSFDDKAFVELGRKHFAEDFPNPTRQGCPPEEAIRLLAEKPLEGEESVLDHITACSPCYLIYSGFLQQQKAKPKTRHARR